VAIAIVIAATTAASGVAAVQRALAPVPAPPVPTWFAPYVDVTLPPALQFQSRSANPAGDAVLGFVVSQPGAGCTPSWGGHYSLADAATALDLDRRIVRLRQQGGDAIVSFGGQRNVELANTCADTQKLATAYSSVIARYRVTTVDFDIEGNSLGDAAANLRRAQALHRVQSRIRSHGGSLAVWLTLPTTLQGLPTEAVDVLDAMLASKVDVSGVNVMTMDYTPSPDSMLAGAEESVAAAERQVLSAYARAGIHLTATHAWNKLGATPMIGQNDVASEVFAPGDARQLVAFALRHHLRRLSFWSLNRDRPCTSSTAAAGSVDNHCSGVVQSTLAFEHAFAGVPGRPAKAASAVTIADPVLADDPATSPYPIWSNDAPYVPGYKVVWHRNVYRAKWWNQGKLPDAPSVHDWETPWTLVGPVLVGDHPAKPVLLVHGSFPAWSATATYAKGDRVVAAGLPYEAKWWTQGQQPSQKATAASAWQPLFTIAGEPPPG
jgi:chitinase